MLLRSGWCPSEFIEPVSLACPECTYESTNQVAVACVPAAAQLVERLQADGWCWHKRRAYAIGLIQTRVVHDLTGETKVSYRVADLAHLKKEDVALVIQVHSRECSTVEEAVKTAVAYVQQLVVSDGSMWQRKQCQEVARQVFEEHGHVLVNSGWVGVKYETVTPNNRRRTGSHCFPVRELRMQQQFDRGDYTFHWPDAD